MAQRQDFARQMARRSARPKRHRTTRLSIEELYQLRAADLAANQCLTARMRTARMKTVLRDIRPIVVTADLVASSNSMFKSATFAHRCRRGRPPHHPDHAVAGVPVAMAAADPISVVAHACCVAD